jgi:hypothetical protein
MPHDDTTATTLGRKSKIFAACVICASLISAIAIGLTTTKDSRAASATTATTRAEPEAKIAGKNFTLDFAAGDCKAGTECTATLKLEALGSFHINDNYPYKLKLTEVAGIELLGKDAAGRNVFSKQAGDFKKDAEKTATLTVRFKVAQAGTVTLAGPYKMSVCSDANCQLETQEVSTTVIVK